MGNIERNGVVSLQQIFKRITNMNLPQDPMMLYSFINMKLRDFYPSLDALCSDMNIDKTWIVDVLGNAGFEYNAEQNKFW